MSIATAPASRHTAETVEDAFSNGDCWYLAGILADRYEHLTVATFGFEDERDHLGWFHMFVHDDRTDTYVDINGVHTKHEIMNRWDDPGFEWDEIHHLTDDEYQARVEHNYRLCPAIPVELGIAHIVASGWTLPPLRQTSTTSAGQEAAAASLPPAPAPAGTGIEDVFTNSDCWALALAMVDRYEDLTPCLLGGYADHDHLGWVHVLVRDDRDPDKDTYIDILGQHTSREVMDQWDWHTGWEDLIPLEGADFEREVHGLVRRNSEFSVEAGIAHITASGWTPPPLRRN